LNGLLDVIVPVRNAASHLETFLASVRVNSPAGCRYLIIDDGSTDQTSAILAQASREQPQLDIHRIEGSGGVAAARNVGLSLIDSRYVAFVDVDDWMAPGQLEALLDGLRRTGADFVRTDFVRVDGYRRVPELAPAPVRDTAIPAAEGIGDAGDRSLVDYPFLWAGMFDTTHVPFDELTFDPHLRTASDRPWFWRLHLQDLRVAVVSSPGYFYRRSVGTASLTEQAHERLLDIIPAMQQVVDLVADSPHPAFRRRAAFTTVRMMVRHLNRRARLSPELQRQLVERGAALVASIDLTDLKAAIEAVRPAEAEIALMLHEAGRRWAA
jgi:glycosyltransferase involved in cell wall biosynthesis